MFLHLLLIPLTSQVVFFSITFISVSDYGHFLGTLCLTASLILIPRCIGCHTPVLMWSKRKIGSFRRQGLFQNSKLSGSQSAVCRPSGLLEEAQRVPTKIIEQWLSTILCDVPSVKYCFSQVPPNQRKPFFSWKKRCNMDGAVPSVSDLV